MDNHRAGHRAARAHASPQPLHDGALTDAPWKNPPASPQQLRKAPRQRLRAHMALASKVKTLAPSALTLEKRAAAALAAVQQQAWRADNTRTAVVLGGGLSGLALAWFLKNTARPSLLKVVVVEKSARPGGWVNSHKLQGHVLESGPRGVRPQAAGQETIALAEKLGLEDHLIAADPAAKYRYIYLDGKLERLPTGLIDLYTSKTTKWLKPVLQFEREKIAGSGRDESIAEFVKRRFNGRVLDEFVDPLISGIYAGDPAELSVQSCLKRLVTLEQQHGSVVQGLMNENLPWPLGQGRVGGEGESLLLDRGPPSSKITQKFGKDALVSFSGGMSTLTDALAEELETVGGARDGDGGVLYDTEATSLDFSLGDKVGVTLSDGSTIDADHVFCALPGAPAASLLKPHSGMLSDEISGIPYAPVALVTMAWPKDVLPDHLVGFGHLVPFKEEQEVLGMTWDSCTFPQQVPNGKGKGSAGRGNPTRLTVFIGGVRRADGLRAMAAGGVEDIGAVARRTVAAHLGISDVPSVCEVHYMPEAIPQYNVGHNERITRVERLTAQLDPRLTMSGSLLYGVACNDIVAQARQTAIKATFR